VEFFRDGLLYESHSQRQCVNQQLADSVFSSGVKK
jgi:hypothetical protein